MTGFVLKTDSLLYLRYSPARQVWEWIGDAKHTTVVSAEDAMALADHFADDAPTIHQDYYGRDPQTGCVLPWDREPAEDDGEQMTRAERDSLERDEQIDIYTRLK